MEDNPVIKDILYKDPVGDDGEVSSALRIDTGVKHISFVSSNSNNYALVG